MLYQMVLFTGMTPDLGFKVTILSKRDPLKTVHFILSNYR